MMRTENTTSEWHLEKKVTITIIVMLILNLGSSVWWAARLDQNVAFQEKRNDKQDELIVSLQGRFNDQDKTLARMEEGQRFTLQVVQQTREDLKDFRASNKQ